MNNTLFAFLIPAILFSCSSKADKKKIINTYNLSEPTKTYTLPEELKEISGIQYIGESKIVCVQDEEGKIFTYNLSSSTIEKIAPFGKNGDYEGIAKVNEDYFILQSNASIIKFSDSKTSTFETSFSKKNDFESLCYDKGNNRLIIGAKKGKKSFYTFDLTNSTLVDTPLFTIKDDHFSPTDIAVHPITKDCYILSKEKILIATLNGDIKKTYNLQATLFQQPEGISFKENGDMYISNEGGIEQATILEFKYNPYEK